MTLTTYALILLGSTMTAFGGVLLKRGSEALTLDHGFLPFLRSAALNPGLIGGLICYIVPIGLWVFLLRTHELSKLQPLLAVVYVITPIVSIYFLQEQVGLIRWVGIGFIILGVTFVSQS